MAYNATDSVSFGSLGKENEMSEKNFVQEFKKTKLRFVTLFLRQNKIIRFRSFDSFGRTLCFFSVLSCSYHFDQLINNASF